MHVVNAVKSSVGTNISIDYTDYTVDRYNEEVEGPFRLKLLDSMT